MVACRKDEIKIFISQLMRNKTDEEIKTERKNIKEAVRAAVNRTYEQCKKEYKNSSKMSIVLNNTQTLQNKASRYFNEETIPNYSFDVPIDFLNNYIPNLKIPLLCNREIYYMSKTLEILSEADIVVFSANYDKGRGTLVEYDICVKYGIPFIVLYFL